MPGLTGEAALPSTRAVDRAVELLALVCEHGELTLSDCARRSGLPASTALRLLRTLETSGLIRRDGAGMFAAGARLVQLGAAALSGQAMIGMAEPALHRIVSECGETAYFSLPGPEGTAVHAAMVEGVHSVRHTSWVGRSQALTGSPLGEVFAGSTPDSGWVYGVQKDEQDVVIIAAPVHRAAGLTALTRATPAVAGALSVAGPQFRIDAAVAEDIGELLAREGRRLSGGIPMPFTPRHRSVVGSS